MNVEVAGDKELIKEDKLKQMRWEFGSFLETERKAQNAEIWY